MTNTNATANRHAPRFIRTDRGVGSEVPRVQHATTVTIETMPDHLRSQHRAAGNWGQWPVNGSVRVEMSADEADEIVASDPDGYARIVDGSVRS